MKYIKLFENFGEYDPYELMIIPPGKKAEMLIKEVKKKDKANLNLVNDLITLGADIDWQDGYGETVLHWCARWNHPRIARMLIDARADLNIQNNDGWTALHRSAIENLPELSKMLIDAGADVNIQAEGGWSVLHLCSYYGHFNQFGQYGHPEIAKMLIEAGADLNLQDDRGWTALHQCADNNRMEIANILLDSGADKTIQDDDGKLPYELSKSKELKKLLQP